MYIVFEQTHLQEVCACNVCQWLGGLCRYSRNVQLKLISHCIEMWFGVLQCWHLQSIAATYIHASLPALMLLYYCIGPSVGFLKKFSWLNHFCGWYPD